MKAILELALEALESCGSGHITDGGRQWYDEKLVDNSIERIEEALNRGAMDSSPNGEAQPEQEPVPAAMKTVIEAMQQDPDYAWGWHCNIAVSFVDAGGDHYTGNQGAARFMRTLANVEPAHELPPPPQQRKPLTEEQMNALWFDTNKQHGSVIWRFARAIESAHGIKE